MVKKKSKSFSFKGKTKEDVKHTKSKRQSYGYLKLPGGVKIFKPEEGRAYLDIIPYIVSSANHPDKINDVANQGDPWYKLPFKIHRNIGADGKGSVVCLSSIGKKCPICEYRAKLLKEGTAPQKETDALCPSDRVLYNVIPINHKKFEQQIHIWDMSASLFQKKLDTEIDENDEFEDFPSVDEGSTLKIRFEEKTFMKSKFYEATRIDFEDREEQYDESIMEEAPDLDKVLNVLSYEQLEKLFLELDDADIDEEDEDEPTPSKRKKRKKEPEEIEEDEEEEEFEEDDEADDDDEEEEEEPPKPLKRKSLKHIPTKRRKPEPEAEFEEEDSEEEFDDGDEELEDSDIEEEEKKQIKSLKKKRSSKNKEENLKKMTCPFKHKFGEECEEHDECDDCDLWEECYEAQNDK